MIAGFDPHALRQTIANGGLILPADGDIERFRPDRIVHAAVMSLRSIVSGWLVGERTTLEGSLNNAIAWLENAEKPLARTGGASWSDIADCRRALALAHWMADGKDDDGLWRAAGEAAEKGLRSSMISHAEFAIYNLADAILDFLLADQSSEGAQLAAKVDRATQPSWPPEALFALECTKLPRSKLPDGWRDFLNTWLKRWLDDGEFIRAACWLKFLLGSEIKDPEALLFAAYDFTPGVEQPMKADLRVPR